MLKHNLRGLRSHVSTFYAMPGRTKRQQPAHDSRQADGAQGFGDVSRLTVETGDTRDGTIDLRGGSSIASDLGVLTSPATVAVSVNRLPGNWFMVMLCAGAS